MKEKNLNMFGQILVLDECEKAYTIEGVKVTWTDYTYDWYNNLSEKEQQEEKNLDNAWDMDAYYTDFNNWWVSLSENKQRSILKELGWL